MKRGCFDRIALLGGLLLCALACLPAAAQAEVQTIDFESGAFNAPLGGQGDISFPAAFGLRPYRTDVGLRANSGTSVGDLGQCVKEAEATGGNPGGCEFFQAVTVGVLARTASSVTLFAGRFGPVEPFEEPEQATLTAFNANGTPVASTGRVEIGAAGFTTRLSVSSPTGNIARFRIEATSGTNGESNSAGDLGIDDLSVNFASGGAPDFGVSTTSEVLALIQGQQLDLPVTVTRLNGSAGPVELSVSGLPKGVTAAPVTVPGSESSATIVLRAAPDAPDTNFKPTTATITADPHGDANVGPAPRTTTLSVRVAADFILSANGFSDTNLPPGDRIEVQAPDCAPVDVPLTVTRDIGMTRDVSLSLRQSIPGGVGLPAGLGAEILPSPVVAPGGSLAAGRTLRLFFNPTLEPDRVEFDLEAKAGPDGSVRKLPLTVARQEPQASFANGRRGLTTRFGKGATRIQLRGPGFCPGTEVQVGNLIARAPATLVDPHTIEFAVPRYATTGPVTILPPRSGNLRYETAEPLIIDSFRNTNGFAFPNYPFGSLSISELTKAFGADDLFITINPCWPFGTCRVVTGILNPLAAIEWGVLNLALRATEGHCFGISVAVQHLTSGKERYRAYADRGRGDASNAFEMSGPDGPGGALNAFLDAEHAKQASDQVLTAFSRRNKSLLFQLKILEREFSRNRPVVVSMKTGAASGHTVLAYDLEQDEELAFIQVYNSTTPFAETEDTESLVHFNNVNVSVIEVNKKTRTWARIISSSGSEGSKTQRGGDDGSLWAMPYDTVPNDPSLPGLSALTSGLTNIVFGSEGAVSASNASPGAELVPLSEEGAPGSSGVWVGSSERPLRVSFLGQKRGRYSQLYSAPGFVASAELATAKGVRDTISGKGEQVSLASGTDRPLTLSLAKESSPTTTAATIETHASAGGTDRAGFAEGGALTYAHQGDPTRLGFTLTAVRRDGGPVTFASGPLAIGRGERLRAKPIDRDLQRVRLEIRGPHGATRTRVLRNHARSSGKIRLGGPTLSGHRLKMRFRLTGLRGRAIAGATLRLLRGQRTVARKSLALKHAKAARKLSWRLPRSVERGRYRLAVDVRVLTVGGRGAVPASQLGVHRTRGIRVGG